MKKLITLCFFILALLFNTQGLEAQSTKEINTAASEKTEEIKKNIKLSKDQSEEVYQAYRVFEKSNQGLSKDKNANRKEIKKINQILDEKLEEILSDEQFKTYLTVFRANQ